MPEEILPAEFQRAVQIVALTVGHLHHAGEGRPEEKHRLLRRQLNAHRALSCAPAEEVRHELIGGVPHLEDILHPLVQLGIAQIYDTIAPHHLICGGILSIKAENGLTDGVIGLEPVGIETDGLLDLLLEQYHAAQEDGVDDLLLALEIDIQRSLAVLGLPGNVIVAVSVPFSANRRSAAARMEPRWNSVRACFLLKTITPLVLLL